MDKGRLATRLVATTARQLFFFTFFWPGAAPLPEPTHNIIYCTESLGARSPVEASLKAVQLVCCSRASRLLTKQRGADGTGEEGASCRASFTLDAFERRHLHRFRSHSAPQITVHPFSAGAMGACGTCTAWLFRLSAFPFALLSDPLMSHLAVTISSIYDVRFEFGGGAAKKLLADEAVPDRWGGRSYEPNLFSFLSLWNL